MDLNWSPADLVFRDEVRCYFDQYVPQRLKEAAAKMTSVYADRETTRAWLSLLSQRGWSAPEWPVEYGGCDWTPAQRFLFAKEKAVAGVPPLLNGGITMCGPALIRFGTPEQKAYFLPRMLTGEHEWCQGYSEPQSGSDLASLQMNAVDDGDYLICNGSKIWTSHAERAEWMFCLVRTSREAKPQQGITFLLIDMKTPGIRVQPLVFLTGEHIQNQVFFDDVRVPKCNVVGAVGQGWAVAKYLLEFERGGQAYSPELVVRLDRIQAMAASESDGAGGCLLDDPLFAAKLVQARIDVQSLEMLELRTIAAMTQGQSPGTRASLLKILGTELSQRLTEIALDAAAHYALAYQPHATAPGGAVPDHRVPADGGSVGPDHAPATALKYFNDRAGSIYAGSNEIQRNIIAKTLLG